jgi:hypothetical protein
MIPDRLRGFREAVLDTETPATILNVFVVKEYGSQAYNWEPETLWLQMSDDLDLDDGPSTFIKDKISAVVALNVSEQFYQRWEAFENICKAFNGQIVLFDTLTPLSAEELAWGIMEAKFNDSTFSSFSPDVMAYCQTVLKSEGISTVPKLIDQFVDYKSFNPYDEDIETMYQKRILAYCLQKIEPIIDLSRKYFNYDISKDILVEFPEMKDYLG